MALALERASLALQERQSSFSTPRGSPRVSPRDGSSQSSPAAGLPPAPSPASTGEPLCLAPGQTLGTHTVDGREGTYTTAASGCSALCSRFSRVGDESPAIAISAHSDAYADPVAERYMRSQVKHANGVASPHISPCDSAYDRDRDSFLKHDSRGPSGLERASSNHDEVPGNANCMLSSQWH